MDSFSDLWQRRVDATPDHDFLVVGARQDVFSYREFDTLIDSVARGLLMAGVCGGTRVAYHLPNGVDMLRLEIAIQKLGAISVPMITGLTAQEMSHVLTVAQPSVLVLDRPGEVTFHQLPSEVCTAVSEVRVVGAGLPELESPDGARVKFDVSPMIPMSIRFTSGSTSRPKGVIQPSAAFATSGEAIARRVSLTSADNVLCALPLFHTAGTNMLLAPAVVAGASFTLIPKFSRTNFWHEVRMSGATVTMLMATQISMLMTVPEQRDDGVNPLRLVITHKRAEAFTNRFKADTITMWAMTETSGLGTLSTPGQSAYTDTLVGTSTSAAAALRIVGPRGDDLPHGELGELLFRHPHAMIGYFNDETSTRATIDDGWIRTGDICSLDDSGQLFFRGRVKNLIKRGGENVSGEEVESVIAEHPAVEENAVCGVPDVIYAEEVFATVALREGTSLTPEELVTHCTGRIADWKIPRYIHIVDRPLPKLPNGKAARTEITLAATRLTGSVWDRRPDSAEVTRGRGGSSDQSALGL